MTNVPPAPVPVVKLGNHGSVVSAPESLVKQLTPSHFICSTGASLIHRHPRWELLMYLKAWAESGAETLLQSPYFHPTCYPVYFANVKPGVGVTPQLEFDFSPFSAETVSGSSTQRFQSAVAGLDPALVDIIQEHTDTALLDTASKTKWAIDFLRNSWPFMSYSVLEQHPITGAVGDGVTVNQQTQVLFIMAQLTKTDAVISYVNGGRNIVSKSSDPQSDLNRLLRFDGYKAPDPLGGREIPWFIADSDRQDVAIGGVVLQKYPFRKTPINEWLDKDDENPSSNLIALINDGAFPPATVPESTDTAETPTGVPETYLLGVPAYKKDTKASETVVVEDGDFGSFISGLGPGYLGVTKDTALDPVKDIWGYYMSVPFKTSVTINDGQDSETESKPRHISMVCKMFKDQELNFGTLYNEAQFNNAEYEGAGARIDNGNLAIPDVGVVVCGLDPAAGLDKIDLTSVLTAFQFNLGGSTTPKSTISKLVEKLGTKLKLKLLASDEAWEEQKKANTKEKVVTWGKVKAPVYRNAIWCIADVCSFR